MTIPDKINGLPVTSIGNYAFYYFVSLTSITIPNSVTSIGNGAFEGCTNLTDVSIPDGVTSMGVGAFQDCTSLTSVTMSYNVVTIEASAFARCTSLSSITIPNSVRTIGNSAFSDCTSLTSVTIPGGVTDIPSNVFNGCTNLTGVTIPSSVTSIGWATFCGCSRLASVEIPTSVTNIGGAALSGCGLINVTIPSSVTSIGDFAFSSDFSLTAITVDISNPSYSSLDGVLFNKNQTTLIQYPGGKTGSYTVPSGVNSIGLGGCASCIGLSGVTIPTSVTSIGSYAFVRCTNLMAITVDTLNSSFSSADGVLFDKSQTTLIQCPGGKAGSYTVPNGVNIIDGSAFDNCLGLTNITIADSVTNIGGGTFATCASLTAIAVDALNPAFSSLAGVFFNKGQTVLIQFPATKAGDYTVPSSVLNIVGAAFGECRSLTSVTVPNSVTEIGGGAFWGCNSLSNVTIGNGVTNIGTSAFSDCINLRGVYFHGDAPYFGPHGVFDNDNNATVHYLPGTAGWDSTFVDARTALWVLPYPVILTAAYNFGIKTNDFGFRISWATNISVVVEVSTTLANSVWSPVSTNTLTDGWSDFRDPEWAKYPGRFYRIRSP